VNYQSNCFPRSKTGNSQAGESIIFVYCRGRGDCVQGCIYSGDIGVLCREQGSGYVRRYPSGCWVEIDCNIGSWCIRQLSAVEDIKSVCVGESCWGTEVFKFSHQLSVNRLSLDAIRVNYRRYNFRPATGAEGFWKKCFW
jgi:hypothetical protein